MRFDVVGVGANSVDYVYRLPAYPQPQGPHAKLRIIRHWISCGGQTATALSTCAALGLATRYVGAIGADANGELVRGELSRRGVAVSPDPTTNGKNQFAVILLTEHSGERIVLWDRDDTADQPLALPIEALAAARLVHVDDVDQEASIRAAAIARQAGVPVTSDIDRLNERTEELIQAVSIPILAEHVVPGITGEADIERGLRKLRKRHAGSLCVTLGAQGAMLLEGDELFHAPAFAVDAIDTTGAGDVFRGGFIVARLRGDTPAEVLRFANAAAAVSCTRQGAMNGVPTLAEIHLMLDGGWALQPQPGDG
ncbi:MAG: PfkB family carbohydrate kinase [Vicinamibacterales bacterium]